MALALVSLALALALVLVGCGAQSPNGAPDPALRGQWELSAASDATGAMNLDGAHVTLTVRRDATTTGRDACGPYAAQLFGTASALWITATAPALERCPNLQAEYSHSRYLAALRSVRYATLDGGILELRASGGIHLVFSRTLARPMTQALGHEWRLVAISGASISAIPRMAGPGEDHAGGYGIRLRFGRDGTASGITGCHGFTATWQQDAGEVLVHEFLLSDTLPCSDSAARLEALFLSALSSAFVFSPGGDSLVITSQRTGLTMRFDSTR